MSLHPSRRKFLKLATAIPVSLPVVGVLANEVLADTGGASLHVYPVSSQPGQTGTRAGAIVLVDSDVKHFQGTGYYLYPDWGNPVVYEVRANNNLLAFYYPGGDRPLWQMSSGSTQAVFSGRVEGVLATHSDLEKIERATGVNGWPLLEVPDQPMT